MSVLINIKIPTRGGREVGGKKMRVTIKKSLLAIAVSGIVASPAIHATNGYFSHGYSTKEKGLAGAGTAFSQDAMAAATNPAGMAFVGERFRYRNTVV